MSESEVSDMDRIHVTASVEVVIRDGSHYIEDWGRVIAKKRSTEEGEVPVLAMSNDNVEVGPYLFFLRMVSTKRLTQNRGIGTHRVEGDPPELIKKDVLAL